MFVLYSVLYAIAVVAGVPYFLLRRALSRRAWPDLGERLGRLPEGVGPAEGGRSLWVHAVSVGEVAAARTLLPLLRSAFPRERIFVSVTTTTGRRVAERQLRDADGIFYCPFDLPFAVRRVVRRLRPRALLVVETEIWPNLFRLCREAGAVTLVVNGRISDRSYPRYRRIRFFLRRVLAEVDGFCMQSETYAERIVALGADPARVRVTGSIKFDAAVPDAGATGGVVDLLPRDRPILVAGSTLAPEEEIVLDAFEALRRSTPRLLLVLAPRHPERFDEVAELAATRGLRVARRSRLAAPATDADVVVLDSLGELAAVYAAAAVVFVGGSLAPWGGHNVIEPAAIGKPVLFGPHMSNFRDIAAAFLAADAAIEVGDGDELVAAVRRLLDDAALRESLGERARRVVETNRGAGAKTVAIACETLARVAA